MPSIADLPLEVIIDNLLPLIPLKDILSLSATNSEYAAICSDDTFWKRKLKQDYNFTDASSARTKGYKFLYKGVHNAKLYVWGSSGEGRLGLGRQGTPRLGGIRQGSRPYPTQLKVPGPRIVELAAGGWSFHALDSEGGVHVWGQLDGSQPGGLHGDPFSERSKRAEIPTKLILPERISKIRCGRAHAIALSCSNRVWEFPSWGRPYVLTTPLLSTSSAVSTPVQVECGWAFSAVLTNDGEVYIWWPFDGEFEELTRTHDEESNGDPSQRVIDQDDVVHCRPWEVRADPQPIRPVATSLPKLKGEDVGEKIVKIAAGDNFLVGLTEGGHVLKANMPDGPASFSSLLRRPRWEYLEQFSEVGRVRTHPTFDKNKSEGKILHDPPEILTITHISAHFLTFFAYSTGSSSIILGGSKDTHPETVPDIHPSLQNKDIISIILGDYHFGALTSTGKLLTWGVYSSGALGLGDPTELPVGAPGGYVADSQRVRAKRYRIVPPDVTEPTEVKFGTKNGSNGRESFVFSATAAGWHSGALVIDLEDKDEVNEEETESAGEEASARDTIPLPGGYVHGQMPFRVGLAGARGRGRGRGGLWNFLGHLGSSS